MDTTWVNNFLPNFMVRSNPIERPEPGWSESTSVSIVDVSIDARISVYPMGDNHPLVSTFGVFEDEALWDDLLRNMEENRREVAVQELVESEK